ncbi:MAG TPA: DUF294 nucleotidyltransferase-like domain-containing protein [bacterium]|nr:DUF294 nucleotidyltransferase-like domain-containing protein [bacterium]
MIKKNNEFNNAAIRIILPTIAAVGLFIITMFWFLIPSFEKNIMDRKREMIRELTNSAYSILVNFYKAAETEKISVKEAKRLAVLQTECLRYGPENKDYFWITDTYPIMIMHPYRQDLNTQKLSDFRDPQGKKIFLEFIKAVKFTGSGYVDYMWQWKDDPNKIVPKLSYVKEFKPWGWIIGTGIYIEDVKEEIKKMTTRLINISILICSIISALLFYITFVSLKIERRRKNAEKALKDSREKYKTLVEATTDGSIMILDNKFVYVNKYILNLLGYTKEEFFSFDIFDIFSKAEEYKDALMKLKDILNSQTQQTAANFNFTIALKKKNSADIETFISISKITIADKTGWILICKDISKQISEEESKTAKEISMLLDKLEIGYFKFDADSEKFNIIDANDSAARLLDFANKKELIGAKLSDMFVDREDKKLLINAIDSKTALSVFEIELYKKSGAVLHSEFSLYFVVSEIEKIGYCLFYNISDKKKVEEERENLIVELQTSLLYLSQPVKNITLQPVLCGMNVSIKKAAELITRGNSNSALIISETNEIIGIVTDFDFRSRVAAVGLDLNNPVFTIMTAPITAINSRAPIFEALLMMQEKKIKHLAVKDDSGKIISVISNDELLQMVRHTSSFIIGEINAAADINVIKQCSEKTPSLIKALIDSGANAQNITGMITRISDNIVKKLISIAIAEIGAPPCKFAFLLMGSEGRKEQTLVTDQDNAIVYENLSGELSEKAEKYFLTLGIKVCDWLAQTGYAYCKGEIMAKNPKWNRPLDDWKNYFVGWINNAEPKNLLNTCIFFDFRCVYGEQALADELRNTINGNAAVAPIFFYHLARNALLAKPPLSFFGNILVDSSAGKNESFNIKHSMTPIVEFARLYALKNNITECNTLERLRILYENNIIPKSAYNELAQSFNYLLLLRFKSQCLQITENKIADNYININKLTRIELTMLKKIFSQFNNFQSKIIFDFKINN